jgi:tRNA(fMet)-specific endonuclease VapC
MALIYDTEKSNAPKPNLTVIEGLTAKLEMLNYDGQGAVLTRQKQAKPARPMIIGLPAIPVAWTDHHRQ